MAATTRLLARAREGDPDAFGALVGQLYGELRAVARSQRRRLGAAETVNTTAVLHEAYARLDGGDASLDLTDRAHFFRLAAAAMRGVIVDYARSQSRVKRGGPDRPVALADAGPVAAPADLDPHEALALDGALGDLARLDPEAARVVEMRYFAGLSVEETAEALALSPSTVKRRWTLARAWLFRRLGDAAPGAGPEGAAAV
ncbi:MAG: ECF-type sigma factor [Bacteroidota bacterium]